MPWLLVDAAIVLVALLSLAAALLATWRSVKALGRQVTTSSDTLGALSAELPPVGGRPQR